MPHFIMPGSREIALGPEGALQLMRRSPTQDMCAHKLPDRNEDILKGHLCPSICQTAKITDPKIQGFGQEFHAERRKHGSQRRYGIWKRDFQLVRQFTGRDGGQAMTSMVNMHTPGSLFKFPSHFSTPKVDQQGYWAFIFLPSVATLKKRFSFFCSPSINLAALTLRTGG